MAADPVPSPTTNAGFSYDDAVKLGKVVADFIGGLGSGALQGRIAEGQQQISEQNLALLGMKYANDANFQRYVLSLQGQQLELEQRKYQLDAPSTRANQVVRGDFLAGGQDVNISQPSDVPEFNFTGGLRPSAFGPNTREFGRLMSRQALLNQMPSQAPALSPATATPGGVPGGAPVGRTGPIVHGPRQAASMTGEEIASVYDRPERTEGAAGQIARAPLENVAGVQSPQVGRVVPVGDQFAPVPPPPPVTGFGGPMSSPGGATTGQSYGGNQRTGSLNLGGMLGPMGTLPGANTAGYAAAPGDGPDMRGWAQGSGRSGLQTLLSILAGFGGPLATAGASLTNRYIDRRRANRQPNYGMERDEWGPTEAEMGSNLSPDQTDWYQPPPSYANSPDVTDWYAPPTQNAWNVDPNNFGNLED